MWTRLYLHDMGRLYHPNLLYTLAFQDLVTSLLNVQRTLRWEDLFPSSKQWKRFGALHPFPTCFLARSVCLPDGQT
jgi:hypothetical protein